MKKDSPKPIRISVPISHEVLAKFQRFSEASGLSLGKSIGNWLRDTASGLEAMTDILETHQKTPSQAMEKLSNYAAALQDMTEGALELMKKGPSPLGEGVPLAGKSLAMAKAGMKKAAQMGLLPPPGNTGGKGTRRTPGPGTRSS